MYRGALVFIFSGCLSLWRVCLFGFTPGVGSTYLSMHVYVASVSVCLCLCHTPRSGHDSEDLINSVQPAKPSWKEDAGFEKVFKAPKVEEKAMVPMRRGGAALCSFSALVLLVCFWLYPPHTRMHASLRTHRAMRSSSRRSSSTQSRSSAHNKNTPSFTHEGRRALTIIASSCLCSLLHVFNRSRHADQAPARRQKRRR